MRKIITKFNKEERELIHKYKSFYESLDSGSRRPTTEAQKHFVTVCRDVSRAITNHEKVWVKYKKYKLERKQRKKTLVNLIEAKRRLNKNRYGEIAELSKKKGKYLGEQKQVKVKTEKKTDHKKTSETHKKIKIGSKRQPKKKDIIKSILEQAKKERKKGIRKIPLPDMTPAGIPDREEGTPTEDFFTREGAKHMRGQVKADLLRRKYDLYK
jgi:uncharacterized protein YifE (UPF0438 family)